MSFIPFTEDDLQVNQETLRALGELYLRYVQENAKQGINADGKPLPKGVDLYRTGRLLYRDITIVADASTWTIGVNFNAPYAEALEKRFHFVGIPPQKMERFLAEAQEILAQGVSTKEL